MQLEKDEQEVKTTYWTGNWTGMDRDNEE